MSWDHDACVNDPVSGAVWGDVLRHVAVWSMRMDLQAPRLERVCKLWKHYWQVAEGVFEVDVRANRLIGLRFNRGGIYMSMKDVKMFRERARMSHLVGEFRMKGVGGLVVAPQHLGNTADEIRLNEIRADRERAEEATRQFMEQQAREASRLAQQLEGLGRMPPVAQLEEFVASWPSGRLGGA